MKQYLLTVYQPDGAPPPATVAATAPESPPRASTRRLMSR